MCEKIGPGEGHHPDSLLETLYMEKWQCRMRADDWEMVVAPIWRTVSTSAAGKDVSSVVDRLLRGVPSAARWSAKVAIKNIWRRSAGCRTFGSAPCAELRGARALVIVVALRFAIGIPNTIAPLRDQATEGLVESRGWALSVANWSMDSLSLNCWGSRDQK